MLNNSKNIYLAVAWLWLISVFIGLYIVLTNGIAWSAFSNFEEQVYSSETLNYHFNRMMLGFYILIIDLICFIIYLYACFQPFLPTSKFDIAFITSSIVATLPFVTYQLRLVRPPLPSVGCATICISFGANGS